MPIAIASVSRCVNCYVNVYSRVANILKNRLYAIEHFQWNGVSPVLVLLHLHFRGQNFWNFIISANISQMVRELALLLTLNRKDRYSPSDAANENVVHCDVDLYV